jgi:hypothetical protein
MAPRASVLSSTLRRSAPFSRPSPHPPPSNVERRQVAHSWQPLVRLTLAWGLDTPQACILAVGGSEVRVIPGAVKGTYEEGSFMSATISCDHRVIDGAVAASWLKEFKANMEDPLTMLL